MITGKKPSLNGEKPFEILYQNLLNMMISSGIGILNPNQLKSMLLESSNTWEIPTSL